MAKTSTNPPNDDAYCFYCNVQYASPRRLHTHIRKQHQDTYAWYNVLPENADKRV